MYLNTFAEGLEPINLAATDEFQSLLTSASDLGIAHGAVTNYRSHNVVFRHMRFHYLEWGEANAPPIVLLHGGHQSAHSWDLVSLALADRFHIYALDQRGHGDSEWARDKDYSVDTMAADAAAFMEHLRLERPIAMGHSMGGLVTMTLLQTRPNLLQAAVLVDVGPEVSAAGAATIRSFVESSNAFDDLDEFVERVKGYDPFRSRAHIERTVRYNMLRRSDGRYVSKCDHMRAPANANAVPLTDVSLDDCKQFACPVLVVRGEHSNILEPEAAARFVGTMPAGRLVTVPACGHNVHSQNTKGFLEVVTPFLTEISGGDRVR